MSKTEKKGLKIVEGKRKWFAMPLCMLEPLADVYTAGVGHYGLFNCLEQFDNAEEDFWDSTMRHLCDCQVDPLAKDPQDDCYHLAKVAFGALTRLHHCLKNKEKQETDPDADDGIPLFPVVSSLPAPGSMTPAVEQQVENLGFQVGRNR